MVSADGIDWSPVGGDRILPAGDTIRTFYDSETDRYVTFWKPRRVFYGGWDRRTVNVAVSEDFEEWTQLGTAVYADELDDRLSQEAGYGHGQVYSMTGTRYERHVTEVTDELRSAGVVTAREASAIVRAAARSGVGRDV